MLLAHYDWLLTCPAEVMNTAKHPFHSCWKMVAIALIVLRQLPARDLIKQPETPERLAFSRYITSLESAGAFNEPGQYAVVVQASVPDLYKQVALLAIRQNTGNGPSGLLIVGIDGDGAVAREVVPRYFAFEEKIANLPRTPALISPENYKFKFRGQLNTGSGGAYVYHITPRKRNRGLFKGQIWIDALTGTQLLISGRCTNSSAANNSVSFVRELHLDGSGYTRLTHLSFTVPLLGRSELLVTEKPLDPQLDPPKSRGYALALQAAVH